jgi:sec-independent protein translocase protein TatA
MGISGIGPGSLLLILVIVVLLFGTKKLKNIGGDLGGAIKGFKKAVSDEDKKAGAESINHQEKQESTSSDVQAKEKDKA